MKRIIYFTNSAWFLYTYRLNLMLAMKSRGAEVIAAAPWEDRFARQFEQHGIRLLDVPVQMWNMSPFGEFKVVLRLLRLYRQENPDAVHSFAMKSVIYGSIAAHLASIPVIVNTLTGLGYVFAQGGLLKSLVVALFRVALKSPAWTTFQNPDDQNLFHRLNLVRDRSTVILGSGIDTKRFAPLPDKDSPWLSKRKVTFLMFSKLLWSKGVREYAEASKQLSARLREKGCNDRCVKCVLLGGARKGNPTGVHPEWLGHPDSVPAEWLEDNAAKRDIEWMPHDEDISPHIHRADVVVLPSYYREGIPRSLIEAMSCGKPIITTDNPGCREAVDDGANGLLVPPKDVNSLADAMLKLAEDDNLRKRMGQASRERVMMLFSDQLVIEKTLDVYKKAGLKIGVSRSPK